VNNRWHVLRILSVITIFPAFLLSCGSDRVNIEFKTSREIFVDDSKTDPDKLNEELEYDIREAEKKRRQKQREAETASKVRREAEQKAKSGRSIQEQPAEEETIPSEEAEQPTQQK
jgi:hypothetical protein